MKWKDLDNMQVKFEVNVPNEWKGLSLQVYLTGNDQVTFATATNSYLSDDTFPRALWTPWYGTENGNSLSNSFKFENLTGMTMFLYTGPYKTESETCSPTICIDNIRICPINE